MRQFFFFATLATVTEVCFPISMTTMVKETNSFNAAVQFINLNYPWTNGVTQRKITANLYLLHQIFLKGDWLCIHRLIMSLIIRLYSTCYLNLEQTESAKYSSLVPRVPTCLSTLMLECSSVIWVPECSSAQVPWVSECLSTFRVLKCFECPSVKVPKWLECPSAFRVPKCTWSTRVPKCPWSALWVLNLPKKSLEHYKKWNR